MSRISLLRTLYLTSALVSLGKIAPAQCTYNLSTPTAYFSKAAGSGSFTLTTSPGCPWTAISSAPWLMITSSASGTGQATISFAVTTDSGAGRYGSITINGSVFGVTQTTDNTGFVQQMFLDVLQRPADSASLNLYVGQLNGGTTRSVVAATIMTSPESQNNGLWIVKAYEALLGRQADYGGWTYWYGILHAGVPQDSLVANFIGSQEFVNRWGNPDNATFLTEAYQFVLGRTPDSSGYNYWLSLLNQGLTRPDLLVGFLNSVEYGVDAQALIEGNLLYLGLLHRLPDTAGLNFWAGILEQQSSAYPWVVDGFLSSPEYAARY